jgi:MFS superfamily sulfate permease-like transporter
MLLLAASALDTLQKIPPSTWMKIGIGVAAVILAVFLYRRFAKANKLILSIAAFVVVTIVFFSWVYNRNEPRFMTPIIEKVAPFFPSAGSYGAKQQQQPKT